MIEPILIDERDAMAVHERMLILHGGAPGVRDRALLQSALAQPRHKHAYATDPGVIELAAANTAGIVRNHPFADGNKHTGFVVGVPFLELNGYRLRAAEEDAAQSVLRLAAGRWTKTGMPRFYARTPLECGAALPAARPPG